ncbi:hypothetical protein HOY80DRAFT_1027827 [Tuber brumale]|nr:hypothetical protein HOY80DRAFT_1027827 [Tuber brumale]
MAIYGGGITSEHHLAEEDMKGEYDATIFVWSLPNMKGNKESEEDYEDKDVDCIEFCESNHDAGNVSGDSADGVYSKDGKGKSGKWQCRGGHEDGKKSK